MLPNLRKILRWIPAAVALATLATVLVACEASRVSGSAAAMAVAPVSDLAQATSPTPSWGPKGKTPVPILYQFMDWGTDFRSLHPEWGPVGSVLYAEWQRVNPGPNAYNWDAIDKYLKAEARNTVRLRSGEVISKPVIIEVIAHVSSRPEWPAHFYDCTPTWVYDMIGGTVVGGRKVGHVVTGCGDTPAVFPAYDNPTWQRAYWDMVRAMGKHYENNSQVAAVIITTGLDGETVISKDLDCGLSAKVDQQVGGLSYRFQRFVLDTMRVYREAFPTKPIFINNCPGGPGIRAETAQLAASLNPPIGLKNSGLWVDNQSHQGIGGIMGQWDPEAIYSDTVPIMIESAYGFGWGELLYWSWFAALHYHPTVIDVHPGFLEHSDPAWLSFVQRHLGVTPQNTPDVWTVMRDAEAKAVLWGTDPKVGYSGKIGDWTFWMHRIDEPASKTVHLTRDDLPEPARAGPYGRHARRTDEATGNTFMSFNIDDRVWFASRAAPQTRLKVVMCFVNHGNDTLSLEYMNRQNKLVKRTVQKGPQLGPVDQWYKQVWYLDDAMFDNGLPGGADVRINSNGDGDEIVRSLLIGDESKW